MGELRSGSDLLSQLEGRSDGELFEIWSDVMAEMRKRGLIRTANNPVADYSEYLVARLLGLVLESNSRAGYDAICPDGTRFQIKARMQTDSPGSRQLGALRNHDSDEFDVLVIALFGAAFEVNGIWKVPVEVVREKAVYRSHVNAHILHARQQLLDDPRVTRVQ